MAESTSPLADTQSDISSDVDSLDPEGLIAAMGYGDPWIIQLFLWSQTMLYITKIYEFGFS